jgi:hypothetical protein
VEEVFVFADHDRVSQFGMATDFGVARLRESNVQHVNALVAARGDGAREGGGELVIHQESHEAFRMG